jgi:fructoselysine 6-phosphate deglycase
MVVNNVPAQSIPSDCRETAERCLGQFNAALALADAAVGRGVRSVFFVGCGGSLSAMYSAQFLIESCVGSVGTSLLSSGEFVCRRPAGLSADSLVVLGSHSGETPETIEAARLALDAGALVATVTRSGESSLAGLAASAFTYESELSAADSKNVLAGQIAVAFLHQLGVLQDPVGVRGAWERLPDVLFDAKKEAETLSQEIAFRFRDEPVTYVLACGPSYGVAYALAMCYLQEMQWMHASVVHAGEFFHGAFEVVTDETPLLVLLDESEARPVAERALRFSQRFSGKAIAVDSRELSLSGVGAEYRGLLSPFALGAASTRIAAHLAAIRQHPLSTRRYMGHVPY